ncbi:Uncharacterised protein [Zhongshania aliphaticivorans]|uniref:DUF3805 domain-containing protein n=1 Tax=Zhongshania aliphaticivorans TaxID=1470434 RepID=A0A5S9NNS7_9GAMM|nr:hypothetical protein [Zhongshania aliphaticivorans]CAA0092036.1 Uncharacterised protein [Zhongshania aliphaticivorans]CAA0099372.1 Uncharacterised protein [Zhongshania aliphaticivorans]
MQEVESDWWFIGLPEEWRTEQDEDSILIFDQDELGCISLSSLQAAHGKPAGEQDLKNLINEVGMPFANAKACKIGDDYRGWEFETIEEGDYIREWFLHGGGHLLLVSYACAQDDRDMDRAAVDQILDTLRIKGGE